MTTANSNLHSAKRAKNDEFYTQFRDIESEMMRYADYDPDVFRGKTILLPCDDPEWSNFTRFFASAFDTLGIAKIISTSYNPGGRGKMFTLTGDTNLDGRTGMEDLTWEHLDGDGDFRSPEVAAMLAEADMVITNPPFSLFREFLAWIMASGKQFAIIGNKNAITYKETFPLIKDNQMWAGTTPMGQDMLFSVPEETAALLIAEGREGSTHRIINGTVMGRAAAMWFTNIDHGKRHEPLMLMTAADNLRYNNALRGLTEYERYDNYDAIEVPQTKAIPSDYDGVMGVPISFLDKFCPEQFEIIGITENGENVPVASLRIAGCDKYDRPYVGGKRMYSRILIRHTAASLAGELAL